MNTAFQHQITQQGGSPFANYLLVDMQWPLNGRNSKGEVSALNGSDNGLSEDCFKMVPRFLRNTSMESFMSTYCSQNVENLQFSNRNCMSCHGQAGADFSSIYLDAVTQRVNLK